MKPLLVDQSDRTKIEIQGADAAAFLHNICTNDVKGLPVGQGCEAFFLTAQGRIVAWVRVFKLASSLWLDADPGFAEKIVRHLERYVVTEDVVLVDRTGEWAQYLANVPLLVQQGLPELTKDLQVVAAEWRGEPCFVRRNDALGEPAYEVLVAKSAKEALRMAWGMTPMTDVEYEYLRVAAGLPRYGVEITEANLPQEVNRDARTLSFTKGCYLGQEPVVRIRDLGHVNKKLFRLRFEGDDAVAAGDKILRDGQEIGQVVSSARGQPTVAMGYLRRGCWEPGSTVSVGGNVGVIVAP